MPIHDEIIFESGAFSVVRTPTGKLEYWFDAEYTFDLVNVIELLAFLTGEREFSLRDLHPAGTQET